MTPAPRLVFLHGFTGSSRSFDPLRWRDAQAPLLTGHGPTPDLSSQSFVEEVQRVARLVDRGASAVRLLGYSMGARVALGLALEHPRLVSRLTLIGVNPGLATESEREGRLAWEARWQDVLEVDGLAVFEHKWRALPLFASQARLSSEVREAQRAERLSHTAWGLSHALTVLGLGSMPNLWPRLGELRCPVDLLVGDQDTKFLGIARDIQGHVPHAELISLSGVGHNPLLEAPAHIREFLHVTGSS